MKIGSFSVSLMIFLVSESGFASTIVQTQADTLDNVGTQFGVPVGFNPFNTALGTLTSVTLNLSASFAGTVGVENLSGVPDKAAGIIAGSVTIANNGSSLTTEVFPSAMGPTHDLTAFDGVLNYAGTSGFTDSVSGATVAAIMSTPLASVLQSFDGTSEIFLTLTAKTFPLVQGMENESATETANATASVQLTYNYTPVVAAPEPAKLAIRRYLMHPIIANGVVLGHSTGESHT